MPQYNKAFDIGTYTGNGGQYRVGIPTLRGVGPTGTQIANSLRFRGAPYLSRTPASTTNVQDLAISAWVKLGTIGTSRTLFMAGSSSTAQSYLQFNSSNKLVWYSMDAGLLRTNLITTQVFKDTSIWYHIVAVYNENNATSAERARIYVNGMRVTAFDTATYPPGGVGTYWNGSGVLNGIGRDSWQASNYFDGYMAEVNFIDGTSPAQIAAINGSTFGEYNSDGIWVPKVYSGSYGLSNGYYLKFAPGAVGTDSSGNGNTWTLNNGFNITTANTTYDIMTDSPTDYSSSVGNYSTLNPLNSSAITLSDGNMKAVSTTTGPKNAFGTVPISKTQKVYFEATVVTGTSSGNYVQIGVAPLTLGFSTAAGGSADGAYAIESDQGNQAIARINGGSTNYGAGTTFATNDIIQVAVDQANGKVWFGKNNTWYGSGNPSTGANPVSSSVSTTADLYPFVDFYASSMGFIVNFGQRAFAYTPPTGFVGVNTYNIARPADSSLWFYGDTPDLMWIKNRSTTGLHTITDTVRGMGLNHVTSSGAVETSYPGVTEMNKFGMSIINDATSILNGSTNSHVYWAWKAGSNTSSTSVTNTDGTITSQVSANRQAGFSIVSFTGTGANATVGHGLGAAPSMVFIKGRDTTYDWRVWHSSFATGYDIQLNSTAAVSAASTVYTSAPTSSVINIGTGTAINTSGSKYIAYCWNQIPGYSSFGSYIGNGSADGPFVYTGFRPRFVITKGSSIAYNWKMFDSTRNPTNPVTLAMWADLTNADGSGTSYCDFYSNGFKMRDTDPVTNNSGSTFIYIAFAETPFKYARAR